MGSLPADAVQDREIQALQLEIERLSEGVNKNYDWIDGVQTTSRCSESSSNITRDGS